MAEEVQIAQTGATAKIRNPLGVVGLSLITLGIYYVFWWYFINREMRDLGRSRNTDLGQSPGNSVLGAHARGARDRPRDRHHRGGPRAASRAPRRSWASSGLGRKKEGAPGRGPTATSRPPPGGGTEAPARKGRPRGGARRGAPGGGGGAGGGGPGGVKGDPPSSACTARTSRSHRAACWRTCARPRPPAFGRRCPRTTSRPGASARASPASPGRSWARRFRPPRCPSAWSTRRVSATTRRSSRRRRPRCASCSRGGCGSRSAPARPPTSTSPASAGRRRRSATRGCASAWRSCARCSPARSSTTRGSCASTGRGSGRCPPSRRA